MKICFISNVWLTYFYEKIASALKKSGHEIYWICVNKDFYNFLIEKYPEDNVLLINKSYSNIKNEIVGEFKLNELIFGDRSLKNQMSWATSYLNNIQRPLYDFILKNEIKFVFGEVTWAHEILIHRICTQKKELNCKYLIPHDIRIPSKRFAFFKDEFWSKIYQINTSFGKSIDDNKIDINEEKHKEIIKAMIKDQNSFMHKYKKLVSFITKKDRDVEDPTWRGISRKISFKLNVTAFVNKLTYNFIQKTSLQTIKEMKQKIILLGLHKQPEASIDNMGRYYEDQLTNILNIWRVMPSGYILLIKEHHIAIGDRSWSFFKKLLEYPNIYIIDEKINSSDLLPFTEVVVTISGTMGYEAALQNIKTLTFAPVFYGDMENVQHINLNDLKYCQNFDDLFVNRSEKMNIEEFNNFIMKYSFDGLISDPVSTKECMTKINIENITNAFKLILND